MPHFTLKKFIFFFKMEIDKNNEKLQKYIEEMKEIQEKLLSFINSTDDDNEAYDPFEDLKDILAKQKIQRKHQKLKSFLKLILNICNNYHRPTNFFERVEQILKHLEEAIKKTLTRKEIFNIFKSNKRILLFLFEEKIIIINQNIIDYFLEEDEKHKNKYCHFFYPEVKNFLTEEKSQEIEKELLLNDPYYKINFNEKRHEGENEKELFALIRKDEVEKYIEYINFNKISLRILIEPSIYETNSFLISNKPSMIEYAAFFGSIQIFQYLYMNGVEIDDEKLWLYVIHSKNADMIHNFESKPIILNDKTIGKIYAESIKCHHNQISKYIEDNLMTQPIEIEKEERVENENIIKTILKYHNYFYFPNEIETSISFFYLCKYRYSKIIHLFLKTKKQEIYDRIKQTKSELKLLRESADENKIYIVYYLLSKQYKISKETFKECTKLKRLSIPPAIKTICEYSFQKCTSLIEIDIPSSVTLIERCSFYECSSLSKIKIPKSVKTLEPHTFYMCSSLQKFNIPSSVTSIGSFSFNGCSQLNNITIPKSITKIGKCSFYRCSSLVNIKLPKFITIIESHAFYGCSSLTEMNIPISITQICKGTMKLCKSLKIITILRSIRIIDSYSFSECSSLAQILIPSSVTSIGEDAFSGCSSLTQITIPSSVTSIGDYAFKGCSSLTQI